MKTKIYIPLLAAAALISCSAPEDPDTKAARELADRLSPAINATVSFVKADKDSTDYFRIYSQGDKVIIEGDNANSMAMGLNYYLKEYCLTEVSWYLNDKVELPERMPMVTDTVSVTARVPYRFFLNYCTSGYSMPWWKWEDWERFIDWMALNGVNLPLATTGQEAIWYNVWTKMGLSDEEIRSYFTGPAHLPWHRMCNIDGWQGPLPMEWIEEQRELQGRIIERERSLGMKPVLPGFAGHVPAALSRIYPEADTTTVMQWGGFPDENRCTYLSPQDTLFAVIQREYLTEQTRLYGTDHIYGIDPFNEVDPPTWHPDSLATISRGIYSSIADVDPEAIWLQMAWILYADPAHWTQDNARAYITAVPKGKMILLDYYCENVEEWKLFDSFWGQPYIWCYLGNFGGNSFLVSPLRDITQRMEDVLENGGSNLCGFGSTLEGLDVNPWAYEWVLDEAWNIPSDTQSRITNISDRRIGRAEPLGRDVWMRMADSVFVQPTLCGQGPLTNARPSLHGYMWWTTKPDVGYSNTQLTGAWGDLLQVPEPRSNALRYDLVNLARQSLSNYFLLLRNDFAQAVEHNDVETARDLGSKLIDLLDDITLTLQGHPSFSMSKWIDDARAHGVDSIQADYYELNARTLISIWGPSHNLNDYANRQWAELNDSYYKPRWKRFIDMTIAALEDGKKLDYDNFYSWSRDFENNWTSPTYKVNMLPAADAWTVSKTMYDKYVPLIKSHPDSGRPTLTESLHHW